MEVMLAPTSSPGAVNTNGQDVDKYNANTQIPVNGSPWETKSKGGHLAISASASVATTRVRSNGGLDRIPNEVGGTRQIGSPTVVRRIGSPRAMPLLSVASLSASFHTDTTMSRFAKLISSEFLAALAALYLAY